MMTERTCRKNKVENEILLLFETEGPELYEENLELQLKTSNSRPELWPRQDFASCPTPNNHCSLVVPCVNENV